MGPNAYLLVQCVDKKWQIERIAIPSPVESTVLVPAALQIQSDIAFIKKHRDAIVRQFGVLFLSDRLTYLVSLRWFPAPVVSTKLDGAWEMQFTVGAKVCGISCYEEFLQENKDYHDTRETSVILA